MNLNSPQKSVNRESHYARIVRGAIHPIIDLNNPELVVSHNEGWICQPDKDSDMDWCGKG